MRFINQIEISLMDFAKINQIDLTGYIYLEKDYEIPDLDKIVLSINIRDFSIKEKLDLWDKIDDFLRKNVETYIDNLSENAKSEFVNFNQYFFTNVELN